MTEDLKEAIRMLRECIAMTRAFRDEMIGHPMDSETERLHAQWREDNDTVEIDGELWV